MKREYIKLFSIMIGISLLISSGIYVIANNFKNEKQKAIDEEKVIIDEIGDLYKQFNEKEVDFNTKREEYIKTVDNGSTYFASMPANYNKMIAKAKEYEELLVELDDFDTFLYASCKNHTYSKNSTNKNCLTYLKNMEKTINTFIDDIKYLNHKIDAYNEWIITENKSVIVYKKYTALKNFESEKYTDYVDLDEDQVKMGANGD